MKPQTFLVTGAAGFIGFHTCKQLLRFHNNVIGIDNFYPNYLIKYKKENINFLKRNKTFIFKSIDILDFINLEKIFSKYHPDIVIHLAALTGVRMSINNPKLYEYVNVLGTKNIYELSSKYQVKKFIFSSSSSVYGNKSMVPFSERNKLYPASPYALSKLKAEKAIKTLFKIYKIPTVILRFFSVYGPNGRPDMAPYIFTRTSYMKQSINKYGPGNSARDFTYIDDVVRAIILSVEKPINFKVFNIGNSHPITLNQLIEYIEKYTQNKLLIVPKPIIAEESNITYASIKNANRILKWKPKVKFNIGIQKFIEWYKVSRL